MRARRAVSSGSGMQEARQARVHGSQSQCRLSKNDDPAITSQVTRLARRIEAAAFGEAATFTRTPTPVVLRLPYRRILRWAEASRSSLTSVGPAGTGTGRSGAFKLASAASQIGRAAIRGAIRLPGRRHERHDFGVIVAQYANYTIDMNVRFWPEASYPRQQNY